MCGVEVVVLFYFVALTAVPVVRAAQEGDVRLSIGSRITTHEGQGNVEVFHMGKWGAICDDEWDEAEGLVVCRALGFDKVDVVTYDGEFGSGRKFFHNVLFITLNSVA